MSNVPRSAAMSTAVSRITPTSAPGVGGQAQIRRPRRATSCANASASAGERRGSSGHRWANSPAGIPVGAMGATYATGMPFFSRTVVS